MKLLLSSTIGLVVCALVAPAHAQSLKTQREKLGYALGAEIGAAFKDKGVDFDNSAFSAGVRDAMSGGRLQLTASQRQELLMALQKGGGSGSVSAGAQTGSASTGAPAAGADGGVADKNKREGAAFLAANRSKPGVQTTASGLQYKVLREGTGPVPRAGDQVVVKYRGTLLNGTEFDNSEKHGNGTLAIAVSPDAVIAGWVEALQKMRTGAKWQLYVPSTLAYGDQPMATIEPGSTLVFDVELLTITK